MVPGHEPEGGGGAKWGCGTKFISGTLSEKMLISKMKIKNVGFVNIVF